MAPPVTRYQAEGTQKAEGTQQADGIQQQTHIDTVQLIQFLKDRRWKDEDRHCADDAERRRIEEEQQRNKLHELLPAITGQQQNSVSVTPADTSDTQLPAQQSPPRPGQQHRPSSTKSRHPSPATITLRRKLSGVSRMA